MSGAEPERVEAPRRSRAAAVCGPHRGCGSHLVAGAVVEDVFVGEERDGLRASRCSMAWGLTSTVEERLSSGSCGVDWRGDSGEVRGLLAADGASGAERDFAGTIVGRGVHAGEEVELMAGEEADLDPAEDVIHDGLGVADLGIAGPAGGLEAGVGELFAEHAQRHAVLQREADGGGEAVHEAGDGGTLLGHADEDLAGVAVGIEADGDVALVAGDGELVGDGGALAGEAMTAGARRGLGVGCVDVLRAGGEDLVELAGQRCIRGLQRSDAIGGGGATLFRFGEFIGGDGAGPLLVVGLRHNVERLRSLGVVAVDGHRLDALAPRLHVGLGDLFDRAVLRAGSPSSRWHPTGTAVSPPSS